VKIIKLWW